LLLLIKFFNGPRQGYEGQDISEKRIGCAMIAVSPVSEASAEKVAGRSLFSLFYLQSSLFCSSLCK
jgi:hypothetical protein